MSAKQGYRPNFKWSLADVSRVAKWARSHWSASDICREFDGTRLASKPDEIIRLCAEMGIFVPSRAHRK